MVRLINYLFIFFLVSCSLLKDTKRELASYRFKKNQNTLHASIINDLELVKKNFLQKNKIKNISSNQKNYLIKLIKNLANQSIFDIPKETYQIYLIQDKSPYILMFPKGDLIISNTFLDKISSEGELAAALSFELIRKLSTSYRVVEINLNNDFNTKEVMSLFKIDNDKRMEIHKWATDIYQKKGYDINEYLNWIQTLNSNYDLFNGVLNSQKDLEKEESALKKFLLSEYGNNIFSISRDSLGDKNFYYWKDQLQLWK